MVVGLLGGITTYILAGIGYFFEKPILYRWALAAAAVTIAVGAMPLLGYLLYRVIEKIRDCRRHD